MISYLTGEVFEIETESLTLLVGGVGYEVFIGPRVEAQEKKSLSLWIYTQVREDALTLFGFPTPFEKSFFLQLLKVNGVGPKLAMNALSGAPPELIQSMIEDEDVKGLCKLPKVGKKIAEQMILALKGKMPEPSGASRPLVNRPSLGPRSEVTSALINLGFKSQDVYQVVAALPESQSFEEAVKAGLMALTSGR